MKGKKQDSERKRKFTFFSIIKRIHDGDTPYDIYTSWGWSRKKLDYWIKRIERLGLIEKKGRTNFSIYGTTTEGERFFSESMNQLPMGNVELHNIAWIYNLKQEGSLSPQKTWTNKGGLNKLMKFKNVTVVWNSKVMIFYVAKLFGTDAFQLQDAANSLQVKVAKQMQDAGFEISNPRLMRKGHFGVIDPVITKVAKSMELKTSIAVVNESEGYGELEFFEPEDVSNYLKAMVNMGKLLPSLKQSIELEIENKKLHLEVLKEMKDTLKEIKEGLKKND